ncbi:MAG: hypothetical protein H6722_15105 [Sandaracinus sp.]|nr:hypothetical protein [Sandaracinus sp.]
MRARFNSPPRSLTRGHGRLAKLPAPPTSVGEDEPGAAPTRLGFPAWALVVSLCGITACGSSSEAPMDGAVDDATTRADASVSGDATVPPDEDAGARDRDAGTPVDEPCESPGAVEEVACGRCGARDRFCTADRVWAYGPCENEIVDGCTPGEAMHRECGMCGSATAVCTNACTWETVGECTDEGECTPGERRRSSAGCPAGQTREVVCGDSCMLEPATACEMDGCPTPGAIEEVPCGLCGVRERFCTAEGVWSYGACGGEGVCEPGTSDSASCGMCGTQARRCNASCAWVDFGECTDEGGCSPGETRRTTAGCPAGQSQVLRCSDACAFETFEACTAASPIDVVLLFDMTGSHASDITSARATLETELVDRLLALDDVAVGVAEYADFPVDPYGSSGDVPFRGLSAPSRTRATVVAGLGALSTMMGNDGPESGIEALGILAGASVHPNAVRMTCPSGRIAGGCWRSGAQRVVILFTDAAQHNGPMPDGSAGTFSAYTTVSPAPLTWSSVRSSLASADVTLFTVVEPAADIGFPIPGGTPDDATPQHRRMVTALGLDAATHFVARTSTTTWSSVASTLVSRVQALR